MFIKPLTPGQVRSQITVNYERARYSEAAPAIKAKGNSEKLNVRRRIEAIVERKRRLDELDIGYDIAGAER